MVFKGFRRHAKSLGINWNWLHERDWVTYNEQRETCRYAQPKPRARDSIRCSQRRKRKKFKPQHVVWVFKRLTNSVDERISIQQIAIWQRTQPIIG